jgi:hypothetical protein
MPQPLPRPSSNRVYPPMRPLHPSWRKLLLLLLPPYRLRNPLTSTWRPRPSHARIRRSRRLPHHFRSTSPLAMSPRVTRPCPNPAAVLLTGALPLSPRAPVARRPAFPLATRKRLLTTLSPSATPLYARPEPTPQPRATQPVISPLAKQAPPSWRLGGVFPNLMPSPQGGNQAGLRTRSPSCTSLQTPMHPSRHLCQHTRGTCLSHPT